MKIRLITFHASKNYGAVLQAYSLYKTLKSFSDDTKIIDFVSDERKKTSALIKPPKNIKELIALFVSMGGIRKKAIKYRSFKDFILKNFELTKPYSSQKELLKDPPDVDIVFTGSDQVFNPDRLNSDGTAYFLSFTKDETVRVSYAPSFGMKEIKEDKKEVLAKYLSRFNSLSCREKTGIKIIKELTGIKAKEVLDPVFLTDKEAWLQIAEKYSNLPEKFILFYRLGSNKNIDEKVNFTAKEMRLPLVVITDSFMRDWKYKNVLRDVSPNQFLYIFSKSSFVVTDSFHGLSFSIIFEKQFAFLEIDEQKMARPLNLLENLNLTSRIVKKTNPVSILLLKQSVEYDEVNKKLQILKNKSFNFIKESVGLAKDKLQIENIKNSCTGCSACKSICPQNCIEMEPDDEGFMFPVVDHEKCIDCKKCENVCPVLNFQEIKNKRAAFYGWHKDEKIRAESSSGGAFSALSETVLNYGGVVFGAIFDAETKSIIHTNTDRSDISDIRKSKYVESNLKDTFKEVKKFIDQKRKVLFCGTPCQVHGLKRFLKSESEYLLTCDFICHGVPSAKFFKEHLEYLEKKKKDSIKNIQFRAKNDGWSGNYINLDVEFNNKKYRTPWQFDSFYKGFMSENIYLRKCCYNCKYLVSHHSEITIADFWGYRNYRPEINDEKGISLVVSNNNVGYIAVQKISDIFNINDLDFKYAEYVYKDRDCSNSYYKRKYFYNLSKRLGFEKAATGTYLKNRALKYIIYKLKGSVKFILRRK